MYSGSESTDSQKFTQWAMNPAAYQNTPNDQVDWAALAQQWIIMKEAGPPPIPGDPQIGKNKLPDIQEGGEAEMDMETEKEEAPIWNASGRDEAPPPPGSEAWTNWNLGPNWNWTNNWSNAPPNMIPPPASLVKVPLLPTPNRVFSAPPADGISDNAMPFSGGFSTPPQQSNDFANNQPTFWTNMAVGKITQTEIKPHNKRYSKVNVPTKVTIITPAGGNALPPANIPDVPAVVPPSVLDANKRKQLPAWIREGLEKMERDKQKQIEKEKEKIARDEYEEKLKLEEKEKMEILKSTMKEKNLLRKSRFDSDNEDNQPEEQVKVWKVSTPPLVPLSQDELMTKVRRTMTEILLQTTNQLIGEACNEEHQRYMKKHKASNQLARAPSGANLIAKLGLGAYDEASSSNEESDNDDRPSPNSDSEAELRESIRRRQSTFSKTEQEINDKLADAERKRERSLSPSSHSSKDSEKESQKVDTNVQGSNRKQSEIENSPKTKPGADSDKSSSSSSSNYLNSRTRSRRRSSSNSKSRSRSNSVERRRHYSSRRRSRSSSYRKNNTERKKRRRRSRSDSSRYSKRSKHKRSRSRSYSSGRATSKRSRYSSRHSKSRSRSRDRYSIKSRSKRSQRRTRSRSKSRSSTRSSKKSKSRRSRSRSSSRGKRFQRR